MDFYSTLQRANARDEKSLQSQGAEAIRQEHGELLALHSKLQAHNDSLKQHNASLKETTDTLSKSLDAAQEKMKLQAQLHSERVRTLEGKDTTLTERCKSIAASAELHRLANLKLEQKHKDLHAELKAKATELQSMAALQAKAEGVHAEVRQLKSSHASLKEEHAKQSKRLESAAGKLQAATALLKSRPVLAQEGVHVLKSSAEVMRLAHAQGGVDSMRECLGQVCGVLEELHCDLSTHARLASDWGKSLDKILQ